MATTRGRWVMSRRALVTVCLVVLVLGCSAPTRSPEPAATTSSAAADVGAAVDRWLAEGSIDDDNTRAVLVSQGGRLVAERYYSSAAEDRVEVRSVTKSVIATLVGAALREGLLPSLDARLGDLLPRYRSTMDRRTEDITVRQLLTQTAGYTANQLGRIDDSRPIVRQLLEQGPQAEPGSGFEYQDGGPHLLSAVITEVSGQSTLDYARQVLFGPLGIQTRPAYAGLIGDVDSPEVVQVRAFSWLQDPDGTYCGSFGLKLTARDLVKLGELYRNRGVYEGRRILDEAFVAEATRSQAGDLNGFDYGYLWWVTPLATEDAFSAVGYFGQLVVVVPARDLVVAISTRPSETPPSTESQLFMVDQAILPNLP